MYLPYWPEYKPYQNISHTFKIQQLGGGRRALLPCTPNGHRGQLFQQQ